MKRILIVDDNPEIIEVITLILDLEGYKILGILSGDELTCIVDQFHPDLILLDIMLGKHDGREICAALKNSNLYKDIPVMMISASHNLSSLSERNCNAEDYLAKPFDISDLLNKVEKLVA